MNPSDTTNFYDEYAENLKKRFAAAVAVSQNAAKLRDAAKAKLEAERVARAKQEQKLIEQSETIAEPIYDLLCALGDVGSEVNTGHSGIADWADGPDMLLDFASGSDANHPSGRFHWAEFSGYHDLQRPSGNADGIYELSIKFSAQEYGFGDGASVCTFQEIDRPVPELRITTYPSGTIMIEGNLNALRIKSETLGEHGLGQDDIWIDLYHGVDVNEAKAEIVKFFAAQVPEHRAEILGCLQEAPQTPVPKP